MEAMKYNWGAEIERCLETLREAPYCSAEDLGDAIKIHLRAMRESGEAPPYSEQEINQFVRETLECQLLRVREEMQTGILQLALLNWTYRPRFKGLPPEYAVSADFLKGAFGVDNLDDVLDSIHQLHPLHGVFEKGKVVAKHPALAATYRLLRAQDERKPILLDPYAQEAHKQKVIEMVSHIEHHLVGITSDEDLKLLRLRFELIFPEIHICNGNGPIISPVVYAQYVPEFDQLCGKYLGDNWKEGGRRTWVDADEHLDDFNGLWHTVRRNAPTEVPFDTLKSELHDEPRQDIAKRSRDLLAFEKEQCGKVLHLVGQRIHRSKVRSTLSIVR